MRVCYSNECVMTKAQARVDHVLTEKIGSNLTSFHTLTFYLFITDHIFLMQCCAWQHTALSLLILLNEHSAVVDRSPFAAAVPAFSPLLCLLFCVVLTDLGRLSLTPLGRPLPMMMCITKRYFPRNTRRPPFEDSRDYEDSGLDRAPNTTEFVHVSDWILALWIPRMKYVVTSRVALVLPLNFCTATFFPMPCWGLKN